MEFLELVTNPSIFANYRVTKRRVWVEDDGFKMIYGFEDSLKGEISATSQEALNRNTLRSKRHLHIGSWFEGSLEQT